MTFNDGMDWLEGVKSDNISAKTTAINLVGTTAKAALFNVVRLAFDKLSREGRATRASLAKDLEIAPQAVSRLLRAPTNMTVETAARLLYVMGHELRFSSAVEQKDVRRSDLYSWSDKAMLAGNLVFTVELRDRVAKVKSTAATYMENCDVSVVDSDDETEVWVTGAGGRDGIYRRPRSSPVSIKTVTRSSSASTRRVWEPIHVQ